MTQAVNDELVASLDYKLATGNTNYIQSRKSVQFFPSSLSTFTPSTSRVCRIPITPGSDFVDPESIKLAQHGRLQRHALRLAGPELFHRAHSALRQRPARGRHQLLRTELLHVQPSDWWTELHWEGLPVDAGGWALPVQPGQKRDVLMYPHLIGMFNSGKMLPPQLNLVLEIEFADPEMAMRAGVGSSLSYQIENVHLLADQVTLDSALRESFERILLSNRSLIFSFPSLHVQQLLSYLTQTAYQAGQALQDARLDGHDAEILALQNAGPFATAGDLSNLQVTLQSAIDGILAEIATLGGATNLVNAPAWLGNVTWDLLAGTNQIRNLHATGPLSIQLANDDWTLSFGCDAYTTQQTDDAIAAALTNYFTRAEVTATIVAAIDESKGYTDTQLTDYSTTAQMTQAITDALVPFETAAQRDAAIAAALAVYYTSAQTDAALAAGLAPYSTTVQMSQAITDALVPYGTAAQRDAAIAAALAAYYTSAQTDAAIAAAIAPYYTSAQTDAAVAAAVALSNGQSWTGGPTFNLLRGSNVLRNLSVAGALTASFQNLDDTILIESDSYARSETYTQLETGAAITAAIDALDLSQFQNEAEVQALIAAALVPYWDQTEVSTYVAGELANYATSSSVTSAISSALSSYDDSSQVDSKIITALLDFYTRTEVDQQIANALGNVDLSNYYTQAETQSYVSGCGTRAASFTCNGARRGERGRSHVKGSEVSCEAPPRGLSARTREFGCAGTTDGVPHAVLRFGGRSFRVSGSTTGSGVHPTGQCGEEHGNGEAVGSSNGATSSGTCPSSKVFTSTTSRPNSGASRSFSAVPAYVDYAVSGSSGAPCSDDVSASCGAPDTDGAKAGPHDGQLDRSGHTGPHGGTKAGSHNGTEDVFYNGANGGSYDSTAAFSNDGTAAFFDDGTATFFNDGTATFFNDGTAMFSKDGAAACHSHVAKAFDIDDPSGTTRGAG